MKKALLLLLLLPLLSYAQRSYNYKNLVLEGGGTRGLAYAGAIKVLEREGIINNVDRVAGSSAGAIAALMISLGYTSHEIDSILYPLRIQQFNDGRDVFGKLYRIKNEYGIFKGERFEQWLSNLIRNKTGDTSTTFAQLHQLHTTDRRFKDLYCTGTNITKQQLDIFSWQRTPAMTLKTAVHISGCIPIYFKPVAIDSLGHEVRINSKTGVQLYVDGGMLYNFPINIFDTCAEGGDPLFCEAVKYNQQTLGLKLERAEQITSFEKKETAIAPYAILSMKDYMMAVMNLMMEAINRKTPGLQNEQGRTIYISYGNISGRPRKTSEAEKKQLFNNGIKAAEKFLTSLGADSLHQQLVHR